MQLSDEEGRKIDEEAELKEKPIGNTEKVPDSKEVDKQSKKGKIGCAYMILVLLVIAVWIAIYYESKNVTDDTKTNAPLIKQKSTADIEIIKTDFSVSPAGYPNVSLTVKNNSAYTIWNLHCYYKLLDKNKTILDTATIIFANGSDIKPGISAIGDGNFLKLRGKAKQIDTVDYEFNYNIR